MVQIRKRNGDLVSFDKKKIINAIDKANKEVYGAISPTPHFAETIADTILEIAYDPEIDRPLTVEEIQDLVEDNLFEYDPLISKAYIKYRYKRGIMRSCSTEFLRAISEKLNASNVVNQNANVDEHSFGGRLGEASGVLTKQYAIDFMLSPMAKENHLGNMIYIHDLDHYVLGDHNCLSVPFDKLLAEGFNTRQTDVRPANSINTAFQLVAVIFQLQSLMQFGGVAATHLDWTMVPYVRKSFYKHFKDACQYIHSDLDWGNSWAYCEDAENFFQQYNDIMDATLRETYPDKWQYAMDMTERELRQAVEGMYHNLNTLQSRSGN